TGLAAARVERFRYLGRNTPRGRRCLQTPTSSPPSRSQLLARPSRHGKARSDALRFLAGGRQHQDVAVQAVDDVLGCPPDLLLGAGPPDPGDDHEIRLKLPRRRGYHVLGLPQTGPYLVAGKSAAIREPL